MPEDGDERQRQLTRMGNAAWAAGLSLLMAGRREEAAAWLRACGRDAIAELAGRAARELGAADRGDEVAADRAVTGRVRRTTRGGRSKRVRPSRRARSGATRRRSRTSCWARTEAGAARARSWARRLPGRGRRLTRGAGGGRCGGVRAGDPRAPRRLRGARGVPRGRRRRGHGARAPGLAGERGLEVGAELAAPAVA